MNKQNLIQNAIIFQQPIYHFAAQLLEKSKLKAVLDIGCSYPKKLEKFILPLTSDITGIDLPETIKLVTSEVNFGSWISCDIEKDKIELNKKFDLIICSDIVEHLDNPEKLFSLIEKCSNDDTYILISTPDATSTLKQSNGRPANILHKREWDRVNFENYLKKSGFDILQSKYYIEQNCHPTYICNYFLCKKSNIRKKHILITVPNVHWIHQHVTHRLLMLQKDIRYNLTFKLPSHKPYVNNLHHIVNDFISGNYDFWLNIDADNPPQENPLDLIELDKDIIGLPTPIWHFTNKGNNERPVYWNAYDYLSEKDAYAEHEPKKGLQKVDAVGTGCILIARRVFENPIMRQGAFMRKWNKDGTVDKGNDMAFAEIARNQGFNIYAHYDYPCDHMSELSLNETVRAFTNLFEAK
ncbi:MAG TPA: class I SAM-dependent methyltransferase [Candidatus Omnitrophica bacterium]|nr:class I SAM-dependent methyltransferase [Candidatus Omnitrophota bacterium]